MKIRGFKWAIGFHWRASVSVLYSVSVSVDLFLCITGRLFCVFRHAENVLIRCLGAHACTCVYVCLHACMYCSCPLRDCRASACIRRRVIYTDHYTDHLGVVTTTRNRCDANTATHSIDMSCNLTYSHIHKHIHTRDKIRVYSFITYTICA
jgi:hypothetical protein